MLLRVLPILALRVLMTHGVWGVVFHVLFKLSGYYGRYARHIHADMYTCVQTGSCNGDVECVVQSFSSTRNRMQDNLKWFEHARGAVRPPACVRAAARLLVRQQRVGGRCRRVGGRGGRDAGQHELRGSLSPRAVARSGVWSGTVACTARSRSAGQLADESTPAGPAAASERLRERSATRVSTREVTCWGVMGSPHGFGGEH